MTLRDSVMLEPLWGELIASNRFSPADVASLEVTPRREAVRDAREFTRVTLHRWDMAALFDDVALVASELVTNALRHTVRIDEHEHHTAGPDGQGTPIRISLARQLWGVVCAVRDPSRVGPVARDPGFVSESGRGLQLVDCFSETWGWQLLDGAGKIVWALLALPGGKPPSSP